MADAVTTTYLSKGPGNIAVLCTCISDGTGEAAAVKIDKSTLKDADGNEPDHLVIQSVKWTMTGFTSIKLAFDHTTDDTALVLGDGIGDLCLRAFGGITDPKSAGGTGDLVLTSAGASAGDCYSVLICAKAV